MFEIYHFKIAEMILFTLVLLRISAFVVSWPIFGEATVPAPLKVLFALVLTFIMFALVRKNPVDEKFIEENLIFLAVKETIVGLFLGYLLRFFFYAVNVCGEIISVSLGLASDQIFNPSTGQRVLVTEQFYILMGSLFLLGLNGHHLFISGLFQSFELLPLQQLTIQPLSPQMVSKLIMDVMTIGIQLASPILFTVFLLNLVLAIVSRAVPQVNVLITSFAINILVGYVVMIASLPFVFMAFSGTLNQIMDNFFNVMKAL